MPEKPSFFIVGAPRSGTTALYHYLSGHPGIYLPRRKEPNFFCSDLRLQDSLRDSDAYDALFAPAPPQSLTGEASALYLYSEVPLGRIMARNPAARIIALLRHPVEAAQSLHAVRWSYRRENIADFEAAWRPRRR